MRTLELFETQFVVQDNGTITVAARPPLLEVIENESRLDAAGTAHLRMWLKAGAHVIYLKLNIRVQAAGGVLRPSRGIHLQPAGSDSHLVIERLTDSPQGPSSNVKLAIVSGALKLKNTTFPANGLSGDGTRLIFHFEGRDVTPSGGAPLWVQLLRPTGADQGFYLDLGVAASADGNRPRVVFLPGTFQATAATRLDTPNGVLSSDLLRSRQAIFSLEQSINAPEIIFEPRAPDATLQLYADLYDVTLPHSATNPVISPLEAEKFHLSTRLAPLDSALAKISDITLLPPAETGPGRGFLLRSYTYADTLNRPVIWRVTSKLRLHARTGLSPRPSTFLIAPEYPESDASPQIERMAAGEIHGFNKSSRFGTREAGYIVCTLRQQAAANPAQGIDSRIASEMTAPWFHFPGAATDAALFRHPKPGQTYVAAGAAGVSPVDTFVFKGAEIALPALPSRSFRADSRALETETLKTINEIVSGSVRDKVRSIRHETFIRERPSTDGAADNIRVTQAFKPDAAPGVPSPAAVRDEVVELARYKVRREIGPVQLMLTIDPDEHRDFVVLRRGEDSPGPDQKYQFLNEFAFRLDRNRLDFILKGTKPVGSRQLPIGILKLSKKFTLAEIFGLAGITDDGFLERVVDATVRQREWTGLILFKIEVGTSAQENSQILRSLIPEGLSVEYVALTSDKEGGGADPDPNKFSINARLMWSAPATQPDAPENAETGETLFGLKSLDIAWYDSALSFFHAEARLQFKSFFGISNESALRILGSYDKAKDMIRFLGQLQEPLALLPDGMFGPIKQVEIRGAEILFVRGQTAIDLQGRITFGDFLVFKVGDGKSADFDGLQIRLPERNATGAPVWRGIDYPNIKVNLTLPPFKLGFLSLKLGGLRVHWHPQNFDARGLTPFPLPGPPQLDLGNVALFFELRLELMKLPELASKALDRLMLDFVIGLGADGANFSPRRLRSWLRAVSFEGLKLDLMRFLTVEAEQVGLYSPPIPPGQPEPPGEVIWIKLKDVRVTVLNTPVINRLTIFIFAADRDRRGFVGYYEPNVTDTGASDLINIRWVLIGHNVRLSPSLAKNIMRLEATAEGPATEPRIRDQISQSVDNFDILPATGETKQGAWVFAAGFRFMGELLDGKFLFQDKAYYGICLGGGIFKEWFGYDFAVSVLYIKGPQPNQDSFVVSVRVPMVTLPAFTFMGGVITIEVVMDGGFLLDVGFPALLPGGGRQWDRAFGAIMTPFQGSGGFYIEKRHVEAGPATGLLLSGGYAVQGGLGASSGGGVFRVWVTVGVYYILEGAVFLGRRNPDEPVRLRGLRLVGAQGLVVRGAGELNWWVISVRVEIVLSAEARATLVWGSHFLPAGSDSDSALLTLDMEVVVRASAEACIGRWKFKICKGISVSLPLRFSHTLKLK